MPEKATLALVIHFHQPVGNLDRVVEHATDRCYRPFLDVVERFPDVKLTLHYSGCLLEWLEANAKDVADRIAVLVSRGQVELMTGGFYEPILAALPEEDQLGQIRLLSRHLKERYIADPSGVWLTERVWEADVVPSLVEAGARYTVVDDTLFHSVGVTDDRLRGPFVTEHAGRPILVYAGDRRLRYLIPYKRLDRVTDYLESGEDRLFVYADDGEKFGEWPDTYERVYEKGWLTSFFEELSVRSDRIDLVTLGHHAATARPEGRVYLPSSSYDEMMTWALPSDARLKLGSARRRLEKNDPDGMLPFIRGAPWRAFMAKYPEVNQLQKRMLDVSRNVREAGSPAEAVRELYKAQCNCAYWHGSFGGVYISFLRSALWHHLMRAEGYVHAGSSAPVAQALDVDADLADEIVLTAPWGRAVMSPAAGGTLIEFDDWATGGNLLAVMARHREAYHIADEHPLEEVDDDTGDEMVALQARPEIDRDSLVFDDLPHGGLVTVVDGEAVMSRFEHEIDSGGLVRLWAVHRGLRIEKQVTVDADELIALLRLTNESEDDHDGTFGSRTSVLPLNLGRAAGPDEVEVRPDGWRVFQPEGELYLDVSWSNAGEVSSATIETASATLEGLAMIGQGTEVTTTWPLKLPAGETFSVELRMRPVRNEATLTKEDRGVSA